MDKMNAWMQTGSAYAGQYIYCDMPDAECGELAFTQDDFWTAYLPAGAYYAQPVLWAYHAGVVNGCGADTFCPTQAISRQDLTVILYRYACLAGVADAAQSENVLSGFADAGAVSDYARAALSCACCIPHSRNCGAAPERSLRGGFSAALQLKNRKI